MPTTIRSGPVRTRSRRRCDNPRIRPDSHKTWTRVRGLHTSEYAYPTDPINGRDETGRSWQDLYCAMSPAARLGCLLALSSQVNQWSFARYGGSQFSEYWDDIQNAARHFVWNLVLFKRIGWTATIAFVLSHEIGPTWNKADSIRDRHNNMYSWTYYYWAIFNLHGGWSPADISSDINTARSLFTRLCEPPPVW